MRGVLCLTFILLFGLGVLAGAGTEDADYHRGVQAMEKKRYQEAILIFEGLISSKPELAAVAHLQIARCLRATARSIDAIERFRAGIPLATARGEVETLAQIKAGLADTLVSQKLYDEALRLCQEPGAFPPDRRDRILVTIYVMKNEFDKALATLDSLIARSPTSPKTVDLKLVRAECLGSLARYDEACAQLLKVLEDYPTAQLRVGKEGKMLAGVVLQLASGGKRENRERLADQILLKAGDQLESAKVRYAVAMLTLVGLKQPAEARAILSGLAGVEGLRPGQMPYFLAQCSFDEKDWARARDEYRVFCETFRATDYYPSAKYFEGQCCEELGDAAGARSAFQAVVDDCPSSEWAAKASAKLSRSPMPPGSPTSGSPGGQQ